MSDDGRRSLEWMACSELRVLHTATAERLVPTLPTKRRQGTILYHCYRLANCLHTTQVGLLAAIQYRWKFSAEQPIKRSLSLQSPQNTTGESVTQLSIEVVAYPISI